MTEFGITTIPVCLWRAWFHSSLGNWAEPRLKTPGLVLQDLARVGSWSTALYSRLLGDCFLDQALREQKQELCSLPAPAFWEGQGRHARIK